MNFPFKQKVFNENETSRIAQDFASELINGDIVALTGNLGSGKTFFVKSVCNTLGIHNVSSPSFSIVNIYQGDKQVYHFDFYRIKKIEELYDIGFEEYLNDNNAVTFIEWAEMFQKLMPKRYYQVKIELISDSERIISINKI